MQEPLTTPEVRAAEGPVVLFDGVCNLCHASVQFILDHEAGATLRFAPLQSETARHLLEARLGREAAMDIVGRDERAPGSIVLVHGAHGYTNSSAALRIARYLRAPYRWLSLLLVVPRPIRDLVYRWIARNRYRWFGKTEECRIPTPELRARFLA